MDREFAHFLGSDAHRLRHRPPELRSGADYVFKHCRPAYADALVYENAQRLLAGE